jgi:hemerythrin superfamily protein
MAKKQDAISLLKSDHETVDQLFDQFQDLTPRATKTQAKLRDKIVRELAIHASIEQQVLYPVTRELVPDLEPTVLESLQEHEIAERLLADVEKLDPEDQWFRPKMNVLIDTVRHHVEEEEKDFFPKLRKAVDSDQLLDIGEALAKAKKTAPTRPHPHAPNEPPFNVVGDLALGVVDRVRSAVRS